MYLGSRMTELSCVILVPASSPSRCLVLGWKSVLGVGGAKRKAVVEALKSPLSPSVAWSVINRGI